MFIPSYHQERIWFIDNFETNKVYHHNPIYHNVFCSIQSNNPFDIPSLKQSFVSLINQNDVLRSNIFSCNDNIQIKVQEKISDIRISHYEVIDSSDINEEILSFVQQSFDLANELLFRISIFNSNNTYTLVVCSHHLILDKFSLGKLVEKLADFYTDNIHNKQQSESEWPFQYYNFAKWQKSFPAEFVENQLFFWRGYLGKSFQDLILPVKIARPQIHIFKGEELTFKIDNILRQKLSTITDNLNISFESLMLACFKIVLRKHVTENEIVVGISAQNRFREGTDKIIGPLSNLLPVKSEIKPEQTVKDILLNVDADLERILKFQELPFEKLVLELNPKKDMSRTALFDVLFDYRECLDNEIINELNWEVNHSNLGWGKYDLNLSITNISGKLQGSLVYNQLYFDKDFAFQIINYFNTILKSLDSIQNTHISDVSLINQQELTKQFYFNQTQADYPLDGNIYKLFKAQVDLFPDRIALVFDNINISYKELNKIAVGIGEKIVQIAGKGQNKIIGLFMNRDISMIASILGVTYSENIYLPIDYSYPEDRIKYILNDSNCQLLILNEPENNIKNEIGIETLLVDLEDFSLNSNINELVSVVSPDSPAYIIYTSGTTGRPKGTIVTHRNVVRLMKNSKLPFTFSNNDVWVMAHSYCFDFSVWEMYGALFYGAKLIIPKWETVRDTASFFNCITRECVSVLNQTPKAFNNFADIAVEDKAQLDSHLRYVCFGGDKLNMSDLNAWKTCYPLHQIQMVNMYGITETTVHVSFHFITETDFSRKESPIGKPLPETQLYIVDEFYKLVPKGVSGEIVVSGTGVATGYLNNPELTHNRFVTLSFSSENKFYLSGDIGYMSFMDGVEYIGRKDDQVKIHGYRIETGEVQKVLKSLDFISDAYITSTKINDDSSLVAYYISNDVSVEEEIRADLLKMLPSYMIPSFYVKMDKFPLTSSGKIDKKALPSPLDCIKKTKTRKELTETEKSLKGIWQLVLGIENIELNDDFFQLGGDSIKGIRIINGIKKEYDIYIHIEQLFLNPTISDIALIIDGELQKKKQLKTSLGNTVPNAEKKEYYALSNNQKRLWTLHQLSQDKTEYNMPFAIKIDKKVDIDEVIKALDVIVERHESLRTKFIEVYEEPFQKIISKSDYRFSPEVLNLPTGDKKELDKLILNEYSHIFNLKDTSPFRTRIFKNDQLSILVINFHHIIADGWSTKILINEFVDQFINKDVSAILKPNFIDYSEWQHSKFYKKNIQEKNRNYWQELLKKEIRPLELSVDRPRGNIESYEAGIHNFGLAVKRYGDVKRLCEKYKCTPYVFFLAAFKLLLARLSNQNNVIIGTDVLGRNDKSFERIFGMFVNTMVLRTEIKNNDSFQQYLLQLNQQVLEAIEHQDYPFDEIVKLANIKREAGRNPLFDVSYTYNSIFNEPANKVGEDLTSLYSGFEIYQIDYKVSKFDLTLGVLERNNDFEMLFEYKTALFDSSTIQTFSNCFLNVVNTICENDDLPISKISLIDQKERNTLLYKFNNTKTEIPRNESFLQVFDDHVKKSSDRVAVEYNDQHITYGQLYKISGVIGNYLLSEVGNSKLVGICLQRTSCLIPVVLGAFRIGYGYLPINTETPLERIQQIIESSEVEVVLTDTKTLLKLNDLRGTKVFNVENLIGNSNELVKISPQVFTHYHSSSDIAYMIYTSGSTGIPKGVQIHHLGMYNHFLAKIRNLQLDSSLILAQTASISFDISVWQMLCSLFLGGKTVIIGDEVIFSNAYAEHVLQKQINVLEVVPSLSNVLLEQLANVNHKQLKQLKYLMFTGEALIPKIAETWLNKYPGLALVNAYGPTEASDDVTHYIIKDKNDIGDISVSIGRPIINTKIYVLNKELELCPIGVKGEIYVSGIGVCSGYWKDDEKTHNSFIKNVYYEELKDEDHKVLYKTGDIGYFNTDGTITCLGRIDHQVKIRGNRIELGDIESHISKLDLVNDIKVVVKQNDNRENILVAYYISSEDVDGVYLKEQLKDVLPGYMIPDYFVQIDDFPKTINGKIDVAKLPEISFVATNHYEAPRNEAEELLCSVWEQVLKIDKVGISDNFFELGGDSIKVIQVISRINNKGYTLSAANFFNHPSINQLSKFVSRRNKLFNQGIIEGKIFVSPLIKELFLYNYENYHHYNQAITLYSKTEVQGEIVEQVYQKLLKYHDALRISVTISEKDIELYNNGVVKKGAFKKFVISANEKEQEAISNIVDDEQQNFVIAEDILFKCLFFQATSGYFVVFIAHHVVIDAVSWQIIIEDFLGLYNEAVNKQVYILPAKTSSFRDWTNKINSISLSGLAFQKAKYWLDINKQLPETNISFSQYNSFQKIHFEIDRDTTLNLKHVSQKFRTDFEDLLLLSLTKAYTNLLEDSGLLILLERHGRDALDEDILSVHRTVGWFTVEYPVYMEEKLLNENIERQIRYVKNLHKKVRVNSIYYGIARYLTDNGAELMKNINPTVRLNYLGQAQYSGEDMGFEISDKFTEKYQHPNMNLPFNIDISSSIIDDKLSFSIQYNSKRITENTITEFIYLLEKYLRKIAEQRIQNVDILSVPADYTFKDLELEKLDELNKQYSIEEIFPLTPMQEGMLYHSIYDPLSTVFFQQSGNNITGDINIDRVKKCLQIISERHEILRANIIVNDIEQPVEIINKQKEIEFYYQDISNSKQDIVDITVEDIKAQDKNRKFQLEKDSLIRLIILKTDIDKYELIWSYHHIILDGWSFALLQHEFFQLYLSLSESKDYKLKPPVSYKRFIEWLNNQDTDISRVYWKNYLKEYNTLSSIPQISTKHIENKVERYNNKNIISFKFTDEEYVAIQKLAVDFKVTVNSLFQTFWALLLCKYNNTKDIVFGNTVSGRPNELESVDQIIGIFINIVPVRVKYNDGQSIKSLIKQVHENYVKSNPHHYYPLARIQSDCLLKQKLFDHVIGFQNFPDLFDEESEGDEKLNRMFKINDSSVFEHMIYDLMVMVSPFDDQLLIELFYNPTVYDQELLDKIPGHLKHIVQCAISNKDLKLDDLVLNNSLQLAENSTVIQEDLNF